MWSGKTTMVFSSCCRQGVVVGKKNRRRKRHPKLRVHAPARFAVGTAVRVKSGTTDPDFTDVPLGGWTGTIQEVDQQSQPKLYLVGWNQETLDLMHPVYRKRCQRDELEMESMWLDENDLELDSGSPVNIEQPTNLITRSLSMHDQDDRIRAIFGLTSDDALPEMNEDNLRIYQRYLATHLSFPFQAKYSDGASSFEEGNDLITVTGLLDADESDEDDGVMCEATQSGHDQAIIPLVELESTINIHNRQLMDDYAYWFHNSPTASSELAVTSHEAASQWIRLEFSPYQPNKWALLRTTVKCGIWGGIVGVPLGSLLAAIEIVKFAAIVGAVLIGILGYGCGARYGMIVGAINQVKHASLYGGILGGIGGGLLGALVGALLGAIVGLLLGSIVGALVSNWLLPQGKRFIGVALGAFAGGTLQAFYFDEEKAMTGAISGASFGAVGGIVIFLAVVGLLFLIGRSRWQSGRQ